MGIVLLLLAFFGTFLDGFWVLRWVLGMVGWCVCMLFAATFVVVVASDAMSWSEMR